MVPIEKESAIPYYYQLADILKESILRGQYKEGETLPSERVLCDDYEVSRATVRQAIQILKDEGLVAKVRGIGTKVAAKKKDKVERDLLGYHDFDIQMIEKGRQASVKLEAFDEVTDPGEVRTLLKLDHEAPILEVIRLRIVDQSPVFIEKIYLPKRLFPEITAEDFTGTNLFQKIIQESHGIKLGEIVIYLEPIILDDNESNLLDVTTRPSAGLLSERISFTDDGTPICVTKRIFRGDSCRHFLKIAPK